MTHFASLGHNTYAFDLPGFGQSFNPEPPADKPLTTTWYCNIITSAIIRLGLEKYHLVGHHAGACLALEMAVLNLSNVLSLSLVGASVMTPSERAAMKDRFFAPFNAPAADGSHLLKTWEYLRKMGCPTGDDLGLIQREFLDHARAWRGRNQIYAAVWDQDGTDLYMRVKCPLLVMCARDDVLWEFFHHVKDLRSDVRAEEVGGANFSLDIDARRVAGFIEEFVRRS